MGGAEAVGAVDQPDPLKAAADLFPVSNHPPIELVDYQHPFSGYLVLDHIGFHDPLYLIEFRRAYRADFLHRLGGPPFRVQGQMNIGVLEVGEDFAEGGDRFIAAYLMIDKYQDILFQGVLDIFL